MMPPIVSIIPLYLFFNYFDMLNTKSALIVAYTAFNLPFVTWMMKSYFQDLPVERTERCACGHWPIRGTGFSRLAHRAESKQPVFGRAA